MMFSLLLPGMVLLAARVHWSALLAVSLGLLAVQDAPGGYWRYAINFAFGIIVFRGRQLVMCDLPRGVATTAALTSLALLTWPVVMGSEVVREGVVVSGFRSWEVAVMSLGATGLLMVALRDGVTRRALSTRPCVFLGRISYSLYLVHLSLLLVCSRALVAPMNVGQGLGLLGVVLVLSVMVAAVSYRLVELPAIRAGNALCRRLAAAFATPARPSRLTAPSFERTR